MQSTKRLQGEVVKHSQCHALERREWRGRGKEDPISDWKARMEMVGWDVLEEMELALMTILGRFCLVLGTSPPATLRVQGGDRQGGDIKGCTDQNAFA
jgi:hypothetical protein